MSAARRPSIACAVTKCRRDRLRRWTARRRVLSRRIVGSVFRRGAARSGICQELSAGGGAVTARKGVWAGAARRSSSRASRVLRPPLVRLGLDWRGAGAAQGRRRRRGRGDFLGLLSRRGCGTPACRHRLGKQQQGKGGAAALVSLQYGNTADALLRLRRRATIIEDASVDRSRTWTGLRRRWQLSMRSSRSRISAHIPPARWGSRWSFCRRPLRRRLSG